MAGWCTHRTENDGMTKSDAIKINEDINRFAKEKL